MKEKLISETNNVTIPAFGHELIRDSLLKEILGKNHNEILYWAGKSLARKYPLQTDSEIIDFFEKAGWGTLSIVNESKNNLKLELTGEIISYRFEQAEEPCYKLEAGFLAEQFQSIKKCITEGFEKHKKRSNKIAFTVQWDSKDNI